MQISKQTFKNAESRFSKNSFARKRISNRYNTRRKIDNTSTILKTPTLKSVSELRNYCNPKFFNVDPPHPFWGPEGCEGVGGRALNPIPSRNLIL